MAQGIEKAAQRVVGGLKSTTPSATSGTPAGQVSRDDLADAINRVFAVLKAQFPRKFPSIWKTDAELRDSKRAWLSAFAGCPHLTPETLASGMERVRSKDWPPDNPGEFLALCHIEPETLLAPPVDKAFKEACHGAYPYNRWHRWSHKCVYAAAVATGLSDLNERPAKVEGTFKKEYQAALDNHQQISEPPVANLEKPKRDYEFNPDGDGYQQFLSARKALGV